MKIDLFGKGKFYKANLHAHSTLSDGKLTPEEAKAAYKAAGFSVYAYTEHAKYFDLRHLDDEEFITLPSYEMDFYMYEKHPATYTVDGEIAHTYCAIHLNCFAIDPDKTTKEVPVFDINGSEPNGHRSWKPFSVADVNEGIRRAKEAGFFVVYNHPHWSNNTGDFYNQLEGLDGIELINGASHRSSGMDYVPHVYRELAWNGKRMICVGGDDNHAPHHHFWGWTMIKAEHLDHKSIITALQNGDCYTSAGPEIDDLYVEDGVVHVRCSPAQAIFLSTSSGGRKAVVRSEDAGAPVTEACFPLRRDDFFFQIIVKDMRGNPAATRLYYLDEQDFGIPAAQK